jgi:DNA-binding NtrC family response regulator
MMILLIEDEDRSRSAYAWILRNRGYEVIEAQNGSIALASLNTREFDLVITDIEMPIVSGLAIAAYTHTRWPRIPILVISGHAASDYAGKVCSAGAAEFLQKPVEPAILVAKVQELLTARDGQNVTPQSGPGCRRKKGTQTWHVCANCKYWPDSDFDYISIETADQLELCNECRLILADGTCL